MNLFKRIRDWLIVFFSGMFDRQYYFEQNPDVKCRTKFALRHFIRHGAFEGRNPSEKFNCEFYCKMYPDVEKSGINPLIHYLRFGKKENRDIVLTQDQLDYWFACNRPTDLTCKDVLFVDGVGNNLPQCHRYRIEHQREQLEAANLTTDEVYYLSLNSEWIRYYRVLIFYRCPFTDEIGKAIELAKAHNKRVLYDIDDLVFDTKYTDQIPYIQQMSPEDRKNYDDGVILMQKTLSLCDGAITTTEELKDALLEYTPNVFINRNRASEKMWALSESAYTKRMAGVNAPEETVVLGYFSGSITHNSDFSLIQAEIVELLKKYSFLRLKFAGYLDLPEELQPYADRVIPLPFVSWDKLPELISSVDVNLAPIEDTVFNRAKSENKWMEAALVRVPTVASDCGAFRRVIENGVTGLLCSSAEEWETSLEKLILDPNLRRTIGKNAYQHCKKNYLTTNTGVELARFLNHTAAPHMGIVLPGMGISGGVMVALTHAAFMQETGWDVDILSPESKEDGIEYRGHHYYVFNYCEKSSTSFYDVLVATLWSTVSYVCGYWRAVKKIYLVQNYETDFYLYPDELRIQAEATYSEQRGLNYLTISKWCEEWLREKYYQNAYFIPNGIVLNDFQVVSRDFQKEKIRILIEGDCGSQHKNVDESFEIVSRLDPSEFEIWYMSYNARPKENYRVDRFLSHIPYEKVAQIYEQCDILLKTSRLESFSYPPLEMMATGGYCVVAQNEGNAEFIKDGYNCLSYSLGDIDQAVAAIHRLCVDAKLREQIFAGAVATARSRDWASIRPQIIEYYSSGLESE